MLRVLWTVILAGLAVLAHAGAADPPEIALARLIKDTRARCASPDADRLARILCEGRLRVGVRDHYPLFATSGGGQPAGYEADIARTIASRLGVTLEFVRLTGATRIAVIAQNGADLGIATMGHDDRREAHVRFVRPHYFQSETVVVGPRTLPVYRREDLGRRPVCVTIGNRANVEFVERDVRLMLFEDPATLAERLRDGTCVLAAQDDSFFLAQFKDPVFARVHEVKFAFGEVPWGMFVARDDSTERLATALGLMSQLFHRDGVYLELAQRHGIASLFLEDQQAMWRRFVCDRADGPRNPACVLSGRHVSSVPTPFAAQATAMENWVKQHTGLEFELPMLKTEPAWAMFCNGIANSVWLVGGTLVATFLFALAIGAALAAHRAAVRWSTRLLVVVCQSTPVVLALVIAAALANALFEFSAGVTIVTAILTLGLTNGAYAGQALAEALHTLRVEAGPGGAPVALGRAVARSSTQVMAFLVNATKGTPVASFIGAPELLSELTDISSIASGRTTTYLVVLVFYTAVVFVVVALCARLRAVLERRYPA